MEKEYVVCVRSGGLVVEELYGRDALLDVCRSDTGDGGWSLHAPGQDDVLVSGPAHWVPDTQDHRGHWDRPNQEDINAALAIIAKQT